MAKQEEERAQAADAVGPGPGSKRAQESQEEADSDFKRFCRAWAWKREHRPDRDRFHRPYKHTLLLTRDATAATAAAAAGDDRQGNALGNEKQQQGSKQQQQGSDKQQQQEGSEFTLVIKQSKFNAEGFASTVWDSSIVLAKWAERWAPLVAGKRCLDLSAGCGLVGIVLAKLGARVVASDLPANLPLLRENCEKNAPGSITVLEHWWGTDIAPLGPEPFDLVVGCDLMYIDEAVPDLLATLRALADAAAAADKQGDKTGSASGKSSSSKGSGSSRGNAPVQGFQVLLAHGRNRGAEPAFLAACRGAFRVEKVQSSELHPDYQCNDVDVLRLTPVGASMVGR